MPLATNALTTSENVIAYAQGVGEAIPVEHVLTVEFIINAISAAVEEFCRRKLAKATYTSELHTGLANQQYLYPHQWPIVSVASVKLDGTAVTEDTDYAAIDTSKWVKHKISSGVWVALFLGDTWESDPKGIELTYDAGYILPGKTGTRDLPYDLEQAAIKLVLGDYLHRGKQAISQESFAGLSLSFDRWPADVMHTLRKHQKPLI